MKLAATILILYAAALGIRVIESSVTLTVQNEIRDISCNKTIEVKLLCEGVNLSQLRWSYTLIGSSNNVIVTYLNDEVSDDTPVHISSNPAFLTAQLLDISQSSPNRAIFSSILSVDLLELRNQNVTKIVCGNIATKVEKSVIELVNEVIKPKVTATYKQGILNDIRVQLNNLFACLPVVLYNARISGLSEVQSVYNCTGPFCEVRFTAPNLHYDEEENTKLVIGSLLVSQQTANFKTVDIQINQRIDRYFMAQVNSSDCFHTPECRRVLNESLSPCTVQYSTSLLPTLPTVPPSLDTPLPQQTPGTLHTFNFSLQANEELYITESVTVTDSVSLKLREILILAVTCMFLSLTFIHFLTILIGARYKIEIITSKIKELIVSMVLLTLLFLLCLSLLIAFGVIINTTACGLVESSPQESFLETMVALSCLGSAFLLTIWSYLGYSAYKCRQTARLCKQGGKRNDESIPEDKKEDYSTIHLENSYYKAHESTTDENPAKIQPQEYQYAIVRPKTLIEVEPPSPTKSVSADQISENKHYDQPIDNNAYIVMSASLKEQGPKPLPQDVGRKVDYQNTSLTVLVQSGKTDV